MDDGLPELPRLRKLVLPDLSILKGRPSDYVDLYRRSDGLEPFVKSLNQTPARTRRRFDRVLPVFGRIAIHERRRFKPENERWM